MIRFKIFLVIVLVVILAGLIYIQTTLSSDQQHQNIVNNLQQIDNNSVFLNEQVLKVHQGLLKNYDNLITTVDRQQVLLASLETEKPGLNQHQPNEVEHLQQMLTKLGLSTEHFLSANAILNNSLTYLPVLINELASGTDEQKQTTELAHQLLEEAFLYNRWHEPDRKANIQTLIDRLLTRSMTLKPDKADLLTAIISHTRIINEYSDLVDNELKTIFAIDISKTVATLRQQYIQLFAKKQQQAEYLNWGSYFIALSLVLIIINFISRLRLSASSLQARNEKLLTEIQQRTEAEAKEKTEASFLQTILDNISDGIVVCDNRGVLVAFNKAAEVIYGQGLKPISADQWTQHYKLYDKQGKEPLKKEQSPLYKALTKGRIDNQEIVIKFDSQLPKTVLINGTQLIKENNEKNGAVIYIRDITEQKKIDTEMRLAETAFKAHEAIMIADAEANIVRINDKFTEITGYSENEVIGKNPRILKSEIHDLAFYQHLWQELNGKGYWQGEIYNKRKNGQTYPEWMSISVVKNELNETSHYISHFRDITEYKQQQQQISRNTDEERVFTEILRFSFLPLDDFLQKSAEVIVSLPWLKLEPKSGIFLADEEGKNLTLVCNHNLSPELITLCAKVPFGKCLCGRAAQTGEIQFSACLDHRHEISFQGIKPHGHYNVPIMNGDKILGVVVLYLTHGHQQKDHEINFLKRAANVLGLGISRKQAEQKVEYLAYHDGLTALPNRRFLMDRLEQVISSNKRQNCFSALMYIDFDRFKKINDSLGHSVGDALLQEVANRFKHVLRQEDTIARLGGDEFVILLTNLPSNRETAIMEAQHITNKLHTTIKKEIKISGHSLFITLSIGVVIITEDDESTETVMMQADTAMYQAKANGRNSTQFFMPEMQAIAKKRLELEKDLRFALKRQEIQVFYQPQTNVKGELVGAEALIRWIHPQRGFVSPIDFIPIAEESETIILEMGHHVLKDACHKIQQWHSIESMKHIAVNVSPVQFRQPDFVAEVKQVIEQTNIDAKKLTLELTEGILVDNVEDVILKMQELKQLGIHFSIDDFGTGYSSLAYLTRFPLDQLKIDKSFVDDIGKDEDNQVIIETIIAMADRLSFNLIAEGVETSEQIKFLKDKGCFNYQGYYFSKPLPGIEFSEKYLYTENQIVSPLNY